LADCLCLALLKEAGFPSSVFKYRRPGLVAIGINLRLLGKVPLNYFFKMFAHMVIGWKVA